MPFVCDGTMYPGISNLCCSKRCYKAQSRLVVTNTTLTVTCGRQCMCTGLFIVTIFVARVLKMLVARSGAIVTAIVKTVCDKNVMLQ